MITSDTRPKIVWETTSWMPPTSLLMRESKSPERLLVKKADRLAHEPIEQPLPQVEHDALADRGLLERMQDPDQAARERGRDACSNQQRQGSHSRVWIRQIVDDALGHQGRHQSQAAMAPMQASTTRPRDQ